MAANHLNTICSLPPRTDRDWPEPEREQPLSSVTTGTLVRIVRGEIDLVDAAAFELNARCRDMKGDYVGLKASSAAYRDFTEASKHD